MELHFNRARLLLAALVLPLLASCASQRLNRDGLALMEAGRYEEGVRKLEQAVREEPGRASYRVDWLRQREKATASLLQTADADRAGGRLESAESGYRRVLAIGGADERAMAGLDGIARDRRHRDAIAQAQALLKKGDREGAGGVLRNVLIENPAQRDALNLARRVEEEKIKEGLVVPALRSRLTKPVSLQFREAPIRQVFDALQRSTGINFILDREVRQDLRATIFVTNVAVEDAIDLILLPSQLEKKVLSENSVLIYPNTPTKLREYQDLVIKTFYLANADVKNVQNMLKSMIKTRDMYIDEKLNMLVMRDTPEAIRLAEKLIASQDLPEPEVVLEVAVLEVTRSRLLELGVTWPTSMGFTVLDATPATPLLLDDLRRIDRGNVSVGPTPSLTVNARRQRGDSNLLANPRIRVKNREKARILVGDRLPVISAVVTPSTGTPITTETVQYLDVGLKLDVEPNVYLDDEVGIKVNLEVSTASNRTTTRNGTTVYDIGTRNASTSLRLKNGETQVLMGLIRDDDRKSAAGVPGLTDLPVLGRLFASHTDDSQKTEVVLSITPRVVRNVDRPEVGVAEFWSGTEAQLRTSPIMLRPGNGAAPDAKGAAAPAAAVEPAAPVDSGDIVLKWSGPAAARVGETVELVLAAKIDQPMTSAVLQIAYDAKAFEVAGVAEGELLKGGNARTLFNQRVDAATGKLSVSLTRAGTALVGEGPLLKLQLRAREAAAAAAPLRVLTISPIGVGGKPLQGGVGAPHALGVNAGGVAAAGPAQPAAPVPAAPRPAAATTAPAPTPAPAVPPAR